MLRTPALDKLESLLLDDNLHITVPFYGLSKLPTDHCARYARLCAESIYGVEYPVRDAWHIRNDKNVLGIPANNEAFLSLVQSGIITPGMLAGIFCKSSGYNSKGRCYTHVSLYLGKMNNEPMFLEQFKEEIRLMNIRDYDLCNMQIREVLGLRSA